MSEKILELDVKPQTKQKFCCVLKVFLTLKIKKGQTIILLPVWNVFDYLLLLLNDLHCAACLHGSQVRQALKLPNHSKSVMKKSSDLHLPLFLDI